MRPVLSVDIARDGTLARREREYSLVIQKSAEARDVMIVAIATKPDGSLSTYDVSSALRRGSISGLPGPDENWTWRFYALDDRRELHSHCRSVKTPDYVRDPTSEFRYVVSQQYPGFRALDSSEFEVRLQRVFEDDTKGPLVAGHFNYDPYPDFATVVVPSESSPALFSRTDSQGSVDGQRITCFGTAMRLTFECMAEPVAITRPSQEYLVRIPPGPHQCATATQRPRRVTTATDSVGVVHGDGTSEFVIRNRDGSIVHCRLSPR
jgi:hypothetical protein